MISPLPKDRNVYGIAENFYHGKNPLIFFKGVSNSSVLFKDEMLIEISSKINKLWAECELGFMVSKDIPFGSKVKIDKSYIFGYFVANDITCSISDFDHHLICSKGHKNFLQVSNFIDLDFDSSNKNISLFQDEKKLREGNTNNMTFKEIKILEELRNFFDIRKGDAILTGAPKRCRDKMYLEDIHKLNLEIQGFEKFKNRIKIKRF